MPWEILLTATNEPPLSPILSAWTVERTKCNFISLLGRKLNHIPESEMPQCQRRLTRGDEESYIPQVEPPRTRSRAPGGTDRRSNPRPPPSAPPNPQWGRGARTASTDGYGARGERILSPWSAQREGINSGYTECLARVSRSANRALKVLSLSLSALRFSLSRNGRCGGMFGGESVYLGGGEAAIS